MRSPAYWRARYSEFRIPISARVSPRSSCRSPRSVLSEADIINSMQARLARYKVPKRVLFIDELPRNAMGKVQKNVLRAAYASLYRNPPAGRS